MASPLTGSAADWYVILASKPPNFNSLSYTSYSSVEMGLDTTVIPWNTALWQPQYKAATWDNGYFAFMPDTNTDPPVVYLPNVTFKHELPNFNVSYDEAKDSSLDSKSIYRYRILVGSTWSPWSDYQVPARPFLTGGGEGSLSVITEFVGNGVDTDFSVSHGLSTSSVSVTVSNAATGEIVYPSVTVVASTLVNISFASPPSINQYKVVIIG